MIIIKVAIIGAGLSGLASAIKLEQNGIKPVIYENRCEVGDRFVNGELFFEILNRPITNCIKYLDESHGISLKPVNTINKLVFFSPHCKALITGQLGYISIRGRHKEAIEKQLASQVTSEIIFNSKATYQDLVRENSHVIVAAGDGAYSKSIQDYRVDLTVSIKGATIEGSFDPNTVIAWFNNDFAPMGYAYLIPYSHQEANIVIAYPDYNEYNVDQLWATYLGVVKNDLHQDFRITDNFSITKYIFGQAEKGNIENTYFVGNCLGTMMPFLGFGQLTSMLSGIFAAKSIISGENYEDKLKTIRQSYKSSLILRHVLENMSNNNYDSFVRFLSSPLGQGVFSWKSINFLKLASFILGPWADKRNRQFRT